MADGQITFAGQPLLLNVAEFQEWMDAWFPLSDLQFIASPLWQHNHRLASKSGNPNPVGLPRPNYPPFPPTPLIKLNTLYWPTGATRWGFGFFICDQSLSETFATASMLRIGDGSFVLETEMWPLAPIAINHGDNADTTSWLLPLVDERYFWQFKNIGQQEVLTSTTWDDLYDAIFPGSIVDFTWDSISSNYLHPDPQELFRRYENPAAILDAAAHSIGQRIVRYLDGNVRGQGFSDAHVDFTNNLARTDFTVGGNQTRGSEFAPNELIVVFPKMREYRPYAERPYSIATPVRPTAYVEQVGLAGKVDATKTVHSTCFARTSAASETVQNTGELAALAGQIGSDIDGWMREKYELIFSGLANWIPCGYDDHIEWTIGRLHNGEHGEYVVRTRVQSAAANFGTEEQLSQQSTQFVLPDFVVGKLDDALSQGGQATVSVWYHDGTDWVDTGVNIEAFDWVMKVGSADIAAGKKCIVEWDYNSNRWIITQVECP